MGKAVRIFFSPFFFMMMTFLVSGCSLWNDDDDPIVGKNFTVEMVSGTTIYVLDETESGDEEWLRITFQDDGTIHLRNEGINADIGTWHISDGKLVEDESGEITEWTLLLADANSWTVIDDKGEEEIVLLQQRFTSDMIVGKSFEILNNNGNTVVSFYSDGTVKVVANGLEETLSYEIRDSDGALILGILDLHYLIYHEENGNLFAWNDDNPSLWNYIGEISEEDGMLLTTSINPVFTQEMVAGKITYAQFPYTSEWGRFVFYEDGTITHSTASGTGSAAWWVEDGWLKTSFYGLPAIELIALNNEMWYVHDTGYLPYYFYFQESFTPEIIAGKFFSFTSGNETVTIRFFEDGSYETDFNNGAATTTGTWGIANDGSLILDGNEIHYLIYVDVNQNIFQWYENTPTVWYYKGEIEAL